MRADKAKEARQVSYLPALDARGGTEFYFGRCQVKTKQRRKWHTSWNEYEDKMSDVWIATELIMNAFKNSSETAILISADADLLPPIEVRKRDFSKKRTLLDIPPAVIILDLLQLLTPLSGSVEAV
ncbi:MAG: NYN domain-containing protein [Anaerolineae bacterium]|nr:NYN domain-containing protein [Anaerolineae bacterium]